MSTDLYQLDINTVIPIDVLAHAPVLGGYIAALKDPENQELTPAQCLDAICAAYMLGRKDAVDTTGLPSVFIELAAVSDVEHPDERPELEVVQDAITRFILDPYCDRKEQIMLTAILDASRAEMFNLIRRMYDTSQALTGKQADSA